MVLVEYPATFAGLRNKARGRGRRILALGAPRREGADLAARVELREITNEEGNRLLRIVRRTSGSVVTWRRAQIVLLSAQGMTPPRISEVVFTDPDTVRDVIHNFNRDGFDALYPRYKGGRPQTFTLPKRQEIKRIALSDPAGSRPAVCDLVAGQAGRLSGRRGGGHGHLPRGAAAAAAPGGRPLSSGEDLEALQRPGLRGQARPDRRALRARRGRRRRS